MCTQITTFEKITCWYYAAVRWSTSLTTYGLIMVHNRETCHLCKYYIDYFEVLWAKQFLQQTLIKPYLKTDICILISGSLAGYTMRRFYLLLDKSDNIMLKMGLILILADFSIVCSVTSYQNVRPPRCLCRVFKLILVLALCLSWPYWAMN